MRWTLLFALSVACPAERAPELARSEGAVIGGPWKIIAMSPPQLEGHTATLITEKNLLIVGGLGADRMPLRSAEIYD